MPQRRTSELHLHRWSQPVVTYFVTCCTKGRATGLVVAPLAGVLHAGVAAADAQGDTTTLAFTLMPDHVHWLFKLGPRLSLGRVIARWKSQAHAAMKDTGLEWQRDFFEHTLRGDEDIEPYGLYVFLNPYRAGLIAAAEPWAHWRCPDPARFHFMLQLDAGGGPPPEWIADRVPAGLAVGD